jgi:hypothetical protein
MDIFDTNVLVQVVPNLLTSQNALLDKFFPGIVEYDSETVSIDVDVGKRRMAPFVSPLVAGRLVESRQIQTNSFKPAYIKDKRAPDLRKPVRRQIGERIGGGDLTGEERMQANLQFEMADQVDMLNRRLEWMAAQVVQFGSTTISGDGYPSTVVNFGRDASLSVTLTGNYTWDSGNALASPGNNLEDWSVQVMALSGAQVTDIVFSPTAFQWFRADPEIKAQIIFDTARFRDPGRNNVDSAIGPAKHGLQYKGSWGGFDLWIYNDWYVNDSNAQARMIPDGSVFLTGPDMMGTRAFGMILDPEFAYEAMAFAPKSWVEKDPAQRLILMQSSPIVIPSRVNTCLYANVCTGVLS